MHRENLNLKNINKKETQEINPWGKKKSGYLHQREPEAEETEQEAGVVEEDEEPGLGRARAKRSFVRVVAEATEGRPAAILDGSDGRHAQGSSVAIVFHRWWRPPPDWQAICGRIC